MNGPTARQVEAWEALQRHGGRSTFGAAARAGAELGLTPGAFASAVIGYERNVDPEARPKRLTSRETVVAITERLDAMERQLASLLGAQAAMVGQIADLADEIRRWTAKQPIYVEMRPRHQRVADGGEGGRREAKRLRAIAGGEEGA